MQKWPARVLFMHVHLHYLIDTNQYGKRKYNKMFVFLDINYVN